MPASTESHLHRGGDAPLHGAPIGAHSADIVMRFAEREAVVSVPRMRRLGCRRLQREFDRLARGPIALGFARGDRIGV